MIVCLQYLDIDSQQPSIQLQYTGQKGKMRLFITYSLDMLQKRTERINVPDIDSTDLLIKELGQKFTGQEKFSTRFMSEGEYVKVIPGWSLAHYGIRHGSTLYIEFYETSCFEIMSPTKVVEANPVQVRKLSKIEQDIDQEEQHIRSRQDTALSKTSAPSSVSIEEDYFDQQLNNLLKTVKGGNLKEVQSLLTTNMDLLNQLGNSGWAAIHFAIFYEHIDILDHLLTLKADPNLTTSDGWNPLQLAIKKKNLLILGKLVITKGIDLNQVTHKGTALHVAVKANLHQFVDVLVENKADDSLKDQWGNTPADVCDDQSIRQSLIVPERVDQQDTDVEAHSQSVYKGIVYRVKFLIFSMQQNYLVCDPFQGTLKRYENKSHYPKKPKDIVPLKQIVSFGMIKRKDRHILMRSGFEYFEIFCPDRLILATKSQRLSVRWIEALFSSHTYIHSKGYNDSNRFKGQRHNQIELAEQPVQVMKPETKQFKKQKPVVRDESEKPSGPKLRKAESVFVKHINSTQEGMFRVSSQKSLQVVTPESKSDLTNVSQQEGTFETPVKEVEVSHFEDNQRERVSRSSGDSFQSNSKIDNSSTMAEESKIGISSFQIIKELGSGSFGKVFLARQNRSKDLFALKALKKSALILKKHLKYAIGEANVLKKLNSPFILQLYHAFQTPHYLYLCLDYCPHGDLSQYLVSQQQGVIAEKEARNILAQLILAVQHMHKHNIVYRDMKPENVLIGSDGFIRLADFGLSKSDVTNNHCASFCGSPAYLSPEMLKQKGVGKQSDVYGLGCILYQMLTGQPPYYDDDIDVLYQNIQKGNLKFPAKLTTPAKQLIQKLLERDPTKRISLQRVKLHMFFKEVDFQSLQKKEVGKIRVEEIVGDSDSDDQDYKLSESKKKPIFIDADYPDDKKINKVSNFSFSRT